MGIGRGLFEIREVHFGDQWALLLHVYTGLRLRSLLIATEENQVFYVLLTVHPGTTPANNQLDAQFFMYVYFYYLHVSGSYVSIIRRITVSMRHLVYVTLCIWPSGMHTSIAIRRWLIGYDWLQTCCQQTSKIIMDKSNFNRHEWLPEDGFTKNRNMLESQ